MWAIVIGRELIRDGFTAAQLPGGLVAVFPGGEVRRYPGLEKAARDLAKASVPVRVQVPEDEDWRSVVALPVSMANAFMARCVNERRALDGLAPL